MQQHRFWADSDCVLAAFREHLPSATVLALHDALRSRAGSPTPCVGYIHPGMVASRRSLTGISDMITDPSLSVSAWECCIAGSGFWAATGRGMATTVTMMKRATAPLYVASSMDDGLTWLESRGLPTPSSESQREALAFGQAV